MKASRSIRKNGCIKAIMIASAAAMLVVCIASALASATFIPPDPINLANRTGDFQVNYTWQAGSGWYFITGAGDYAFNGLYWNGLAWQIDCEIVSGLGNIGMNSAPTVFQKDGVWYLVSGEIAGSFHGYNWTGSAWQIDCEIVSGLGDLGMNSAPTVFQKDGVWQLVSGEVNGSFHGYNWTGSAWQGDCRIVSGLVDVADASAPTVFQKDGIWHLVSGEMNGSFHGYNWTGSTWQSDCGIVSGLGDLGMNSAPTVFLKDRRWYLISGEIAGSFHGYNRTGSTWQGDCRIVSGLVDVADASAPTVFDMGNVTDSYNISVNDVWNNGTTNTSVNGIGGSGGWANITVWAWNASGAGTLSAGCVSDNVQASETEGLNDTFGFVGSAPTGGEGTYPPGWFETPTPTVTVTAAKTPAESEANASVDVPATATPAATKRPAATQAYTNAAAARGTATESPVGQGLPGFTAVFATTGCLLAVYVLVRRRR
ncbi:MAG: hypothetical protein ACXQTY_04615 [Candidatus Methanogasteraceae archaeon]